MAAIRVAVDRYHKDCRETLEWLAATEALWMTAPPTTDVRRRLRAPQMEALYEAAFLRMFAAWEVMLEEVTVRMMAGASTPSWAAQAANGQTLYSTLGGARAALYNGADFLLWHNPQKVVVRVARFLNGSPVESEITASASDLQHLANIRHRIAHSSDDATTKFRAAALALTGLTFSGSPGRLLRSQDISDPLNPARWISRFDTQMRDVVARIVA